MIKTVPLLWTLLTALVIGFITGLFSDGYARRLTGRKAGRHLVISGAVTALVFAGIAAVYGISINSLKYLLLSAVLITASLTDLYEGIIPDRLIIAGIVVFIAFSFFSSSPLHTLGRGISGSALIAGPLLGLVLLADKLYKKETMGGGDIKLFFMAGLYFDWKLNLLLLVAACFIGIVTAFIMGKARLNAAFPFGPSIAGAALLVILAGGKILDWYLGLFVI